MTNTMSHFFLVILALNFLGGKSTIFTLRNECETTVWPGFQSGAGRPKLLNGGLELNPGVSVQISAPTGWSGRLWARTNCFFDQYGRGNCATGDCNNLLECAGAGGTPPATLVEFTLHSSLDKNRGRGLSIPSLPLDFYDISLVDGFNIPITITPIESPTEGCQIAGCPYNLNQKCPNELKVRRNGHVIACKSACLAFERPEFCCTGAYNSPNLCKPNNYSEIFKGLCPQAYSYAYDDNTSVFTCQGADYIITFC